MNTKFFEFPQNNSGGFYVQDIANGVGKNIIIEALDARHAVNRLKEIGDESSCNFWGYCKCCGERWSTWLSDEDGMDSPELTEHSHDEYFVHYLDGRVEYKPKQEDYED